MPIRPNALAIALGIHVLIVIAFLVARDWNVEAPPPPEAQLIFTTIETVAPPPLPVVDPAPGASGGPAPTPRPAPAPPRPALKKKIDVVKMDEDMEKRMVDALTASAPSTTDADMTARQPTADLDQAAGGGGADVGGGGGRGGGLGGLGDGVDLSAKPQPLDTTSASTLPYTKEAMRDHVEGDVTLVLQIDATGYVTSTAVQRGIGHGLDEIAATVARKFTFKPALDRYGKKTAGSVRWRFHFTRPT